MFTRTAAVLAAGLALAATAQDRPVKTKPANAPSTSTLPVPTAGKKVTLKKKPKTTAATTASPDGRRKVTYQAYINENPPEVVVPEKKWAMGLDGWFDSEGLNLEVVYAGMGMTRMRAAPGGGTGPGGRSWAAEPGDVLLAVNDIVVDGYDALIYAVNASSNPRDLKILLRDGRTGADHEFYITCTKLKP